MKRSLRKMFAGALVLAVAAALLSVGGPAQARTQPRMTISPEIGTVQKSFPAFLANRPASALAAQVKNCKDGQANSQYCDSIPITAAVPKNYKPIHKVRIQVYWDPGPTNNNMIIYLFPDPEVDEVDETALNTSGSNNDTTAGKKPPRQIDVGEMSGNATLNVVNTSPGNTGYSVKLEWITIDLGPDYPGPNSGEDDTSPSFSPSPARKSNAPINPAFDVGASAEEQETITVKVPGPDGELIDVEIPLVKAAGVSEKGEGSSPVVPIVLGLIGLGLLLFLYFFVWRRRRGEQAT